MMKKIWIISDTHFGHFKMQEYCNRPQGFEKKIVSNLTKMIDWDDILIHLGDVCMGQDEKMHNQYIKPLPFTKILVKGNHDGKSNSWYLEHGWDFVCRYFVDKYYGQKILFSHYPRGDIPCDYNIHGHFHNTNHHCWEPEFVEIMKKNPDRYLLLSTEIEKYRPILLKTLLERH